MWPATWYSKPFMHSLKYMADQPPVGSSIFGPLPLGKVTMRRPASPGMAYQRPGLLTCRYGPTSGVKL